MNTSTIVTRRMWPGSRAVYYTEPGTETLAALISPRRLAGKPRPRVDRRVYPKHLEGESTSSYVARFFEMNTRRATMRTTSTNVHAYDDYVDHLALYHPLSTAPQFTPLDDVVHEVTE
jgi:hypothetical protein